MNVTGGSLYLRASQQLPDDPKYSLSANAREECCSSGHDFAHRAICCAHGCAAGEAQDQRRADRAFCPRSRRDCPVHGGDRPEAAQPIAPRGCLPSFRAVSTRRPPGRNALGEAFGSPTARLYQAERQANGRTIARTGAYRVSVVRPLLTERRKNEAVQPGPGI